MSGGPKGAKWPLGRPLDGGVRFHIATAECGHMETVHVADEPLFEFEWNQLEDAPREFEEALLSIVARSQGEEFHAIGAGFVVKAGDDSALVLSAAHVFAEVQRLQRKRGHPSHRTTLSEFSPLPKPVDLRLRDLATLTLKEERVVVGQMTGLAFDERGDFAIAQIKAQKAKRLSFPSENLCLMTSCRELASWFALLATLTWLVQRRKPIDSKFVEDSLCASGECETCFQKDNDFAVDRVLRSRSLSTQA